MQRINLVFWLCVETGLINLRSDDPVYPESIRSPVSGRRLDDPVGTGPFGVRGSIREGVFIPFFSLSQPYFLHQVGHLFLSPSPLASPVCRVPISSMRHRIDDRRAGFFSSRSSPPILVHLTCFFGCGLLPQRFAPILFFPIPFLTRLRTAYLMDCLVKYSKP